ncbi:hypothetical protein M9H77_09524 [Catharanthus roseus]|uniref:Uncharacterized protein n=1 Tax=Catharanthus roseus TaxID=4058 RepID=A0ACC0C0U6_CATRO|nr:hypothetical protein M9H77_09524 [Catharanthus roseus]
MKRILMASSVVHFLRRCTNFGVSLKINPLLFFFSQNHSSVGFNFSTAVKNINNIDDTLSLFREMVRRRPLPSAIQFNKLLGAFVKMKHYSTAICLVKKILTIPLPFDHCTLNIMINCYSHLNLIEFGYSVLAIFFKSGHTLEASTFNTLLKGLVLENRIIEANQLFMKLVRDKACCEPNAITYSTCINGLCKSGFTERALALLRLTEQGKCKPCVSAYNTVIDSLCKERMVDEALKLFRQMMDRSIVPDVVTYTSLMHGLCNFCRWREVKDLLDEMVIHKIPLNVHTYNVLIGAVCKDGKAKDAEDILSCMIRRGEEPTTVTYSSLIHGYCLLGNMEEARRIFNSMVDKGLDPDSTCYSILINGYCKKYNLEEAKNLFKIMTKKGLKLDTFTYSPIMKGLFHAGKCEEAYETFHEMQANGIQPDLITHGILLDGLCKNRHVEEALSIFYELKTKGDVNITMYNVLIIGLLHIRKINEAKELFADAISRGLEPDVRTYNLMVSGFVQEGLLHEANNLLRKMEVVGCYPGHVTYNVIMRGFLKKNNVEGALELLKEMVGRGFSPYSSTVSLFMKLIPANDRDSTLLNVIQKFGPKIEKFLYQVLKFLRITETSQEIIRRKDLSLDVFIAMILLFSEVSSSANQYEPYLGNKLLKNCTAPLEGLTNAEQKSEAQAAMLGDCDSHAQRLASVRPVAHGPEFKGVSAIKREQKEKEEVAKETKMILKLKKMQHTIYYAAHSDWRFDYVFSISQIVVSQLQKTLSIANFRAYHVRFYRVDRIYRVLENLKLSFFWVIVIIRFRLTRNDIISVRSVNLIIIVIDGTVQHRRFIRNHLCYRCNMFRQICCISNWCHVELEYFVAGYARIQQEYESLISLGAME